MRRILLQIRMEEMLNEGACAILDIRGDAVTPSSFASSRQAFGNLTFEQQVAILVANHIRNATFDPTTGQEVCYCCGKPYFSVHGRHFLN